MLGSVKYYRKKSVRIRGMKTARVVVETLSRVVRIDLNEKVTFGQRLDRSKEMVLLVTWWKSIPDRGISQGKASQPRMFPDHWRNTQDTNV